MAETSQAAAPERRWLQFRLRTLLLAPFFILLLQVLSDQLFDHLILLWCAYGAFFGVAWGLGRMRIVGLRRAGLARVLPVAKAAIDGGMLGGALTGPLVLWTALWRSGAWRYFNARGILNDAWEMFTSGVAGYWCGGFFGALAGGAVGTVAAYLVCLTARTFGAESWFQSSASDEAAAQIAAARAGSWRLRGRKALAVALAIGPPIWLACCLRGDWAEREIIERLRLRGFISQQRTFYGPQWFEHVVVPGYELTWFRRGGAVYFAGHIAPETFDDFVRLSEVHAIHFEVETEADLIVGAELLRRRPDVAASISSHGPFKLTWDRRTGAFAFSGLIALQTLDDFMRLADIRNIEFHLEADADLILAAGFLRRRPDVHASISLHRPEVTDQGFASLESLTNLERLEFSDISITDLSVEIVESLPNLKCVTAMGRSQLSIEGETRVYLAVPDAYFQRNIWKSRGRWNVQRFKKVESAP
ncbi:MAG TPA: hypothetical protein VMV10_20810 [Pirellulales bacterium]|nr:hypothetical protein [Pirellulales bacterium]